MERPLESPRANGGSRARTRRNMRQHGSSLELPSYKLAPECVCVWESVFSPTGVCAARPTCLSTSDGVFVRGDYSVRVISCSRSSRAEIRGIRRGYGESLRVRSVRQRYERRFLNKGEVRLYP